MVTREDVTRPLGFGPIGNKDSRTLLSLPFALSTYWKAIPSLSCYSNVFSLPVDDDGKLPGQALGLDRHVPSASHPWSLGLPPGPVHRFNLQSVDSRFFPGAMGIHLHSCKKLLRVGAVPQLWEQQDRSF